MKTIHNGTEIIKTMSKTELCQKYGVCLETLNKWIESIQEIKLTPGQRILTPAQVRLIFERIGEP